MTPISHHPAEMTLHRLVDADLPAAESRAVERHVAGCVECGAVVEQLEQLRRLTLRLPRAIEPPAELSARLIEALPPPGTPVPAARNRPWRRHRAAVGIAALLLLAAVGSWATVRYGAPWAAPDAPPPARSAAPPLAVPSPAAGTPTAAPASAESRLLTELDRRASLLSPNTVRDVRQNVREVNGAVAATRRALAREPNNVHVEAMLDRSRRLQAEFLRSTMTLLGDS